MISPALRLAVIVAAAAGTASAFQPLVGVARAASKSLPCLHAEPETTTTTPSDRRAFLGSSAALLLATTTTTTLTLGAAPSRVHAAAAVDYKAVASDVAGLLKANPDWGPTFVRLAWHSSGTYDKMTKTGGSGGGTIRFTEELVHGGNAGLAVTAVKWLEPVHKKYKGGVSYADLYTLAGVSAIMAMGGPTIPWSAGRVDALDPTASVTPDGRLPNADVGAKGAEDKDSQHLRDVFYRMGFDDQEIVCLSGAHALGRCHTTASGYDGPWTPTPTTFNNAYFTLLMNLKWVPKEWDGPYQYVDAGSGKLMMLPTDLVLLEDKSFVKWVETYAKDSEKFNTDFTKAFQKLEELGTTDLTPTEWA